MTEPLRTAPAVVPAPEIREGMTVYICPRCGVEMLRSDNLKRHMVTSYRCYLNYKRNLGKPVPTPTTQNTEIETHSPAVAPPKPVVISPSPRSCWCARGSGNSMFAREHSYEPRTTCPYGGPISRG